MFTQCVTHLHNSQLKTRWIGWGVMWVAGYSGFKHKGTAEHQMNQPFYNLALTSVLAFDLKKTSAMRAPQTIAKLVEKTPITSSNYGL